MKYKHAREILKKHRDKLLKEAKHSHFVTVEKDGEKLIVNVYVTKKHTSHSKVKEQKLKLKDVDLEALDVKVTVSKPITAFAARTDKWRPAPGGVSIGHYNITAGTLGCTVYKNATKYILSNNHVLADCNDGDIEDAIYQPGPYDGGTIDDKIGELFEYVTLVFNDKLSPNTVDCALCVPDLAADVDDAIIDLEYPTAIEEPTIGNAIVKSGRTTGIKEGTILGIGDGWVNYGSKGLAWFEDQIVTTNISAGGDSGSLVVDKDSGVAVGLLFAGSSSITVSNKMTEVASELSIILLDQKLIDDEAVVNLSCSVVSDPVAATVCTDEAVIELSNSVAVEVGTGKPIADETVVNLSASCLLEKITPVVIICSATAYLSALTTNYGYAHYGPNDIAGRYRVADDSLEQYELYRGQDAEPDFDADPWETFASLPHTTGVVMDMDLRPNCVAQFKMNDKAANPYVVGLSGVPTELVQNNCFDDDSIWDWYFGWYWSEAFHTAEIIVDVGWVGQNIGCVAGKKYLIVFALSSKNGSPVVTPWVGFQAGTARTANGFYAEVITCGEDYEGYTGMIWFQKTGVGWITLDNVYCICLDDFPNTGVLFDGSNNFTSDHSVAGKINRALHFDGVDDLIIVYDEDALEFPSDTQDFSIAFLVRFAELGTFVHLFDKRDGVNDGWTIYKYSNNQIYFRIQDLIGALSAPITDTNWYLVTLVVDRDGNGQFYIDNVASGAPRDTSGKTMDVTNPLHIAEDYSGGYRFKGDIDVTGFFDKALSQAERDFIWNNGNCREGLVAAQTYHFATRKRNKYNLVSQNIESWDLEVDEDGNVLYNPAAPQNINITPAPSAKALVKAQYIYDPDTSNTATIWLIYFTDDGTDPDPDNDTPTEVTMYKSNGIAHLNWTSPAADHDDTLKVLVRTRVTLNGTDYDSQNTTFYSCTANDQGPAAPTGRAFFDKVSEAM